MTNDQSDTAQTIMVNTNTFREKQKNKNLKEVDIDRIVIQQTPEEPKQPQQPESEKSRNTDTSVRTYRLNKNWKQDMKKNTLKVGKLDVKKIEERNEEFKKMEKERQMYKAKKVS